MIHLIIDPQIRSVAPSLVLGWVRAGVVAAPTGSELDDELSAAATVASARTEEPAALPEIRALREIYKALGKEPSRYRGSPEALVRRARSGKDIYRILNLVDAVNVVSLETLLPIGLYDASKIEGDEVVFRRGAEGETYAAIGRDEMNLAGLPLLADAAGPFGSPTSDSERTKVTMETREVFAVVFGVTGRAELEAALGHLAGLVGRHAAARDVETGLVD